MSSLSFRRKLAQDFKKSKDELINDCINLQKTLNLVNLDSMGMNKEDLRRFKQGHRGAINCAKYALMKKFNYCYEQE